MGRSPSATRAAALLPIVVFSATVIVACSSSATGAPSGPSSPALSPGESAASAGQSSATAVASAGPQAPSPAASPPSPVASSTPAPFRLASPAFGQNDPIPAEFTCKGADHSPALTWTGVPVLAKALVLTVVDPDAGGFVHWTVLDLDPARTSVPQGVTPAADGIQQGRNGFGRVGYGGPCPPSGNHHYRFTLSALASPLGLAGHPSGATVLTALDRAEVLGRATLVGTFRA